MERDELTNFTLHLESLTRSRDKNIAGTNVRFYPASTLRRDIVMRLRDAVGRSSMREIRAAVFPEKTRFLSSFPGPPKPHKPPRLDSPENIHAPGVCHDIAVARNLYYTYLCDT